MLSRDSTQRTFNSPLTTRCCHTCPHKAGFPYPLINDDTRRIRSPSGLLEPPVFFPGTVDTIHVYNLSNIVSMSVHITRCALSTFLFIHFTTTKHVSEQYAQSRVPDFTNKQVSYFRYTRQLILPLHKTDDFNKIISYTVDQCRPTSNSKPHSTLHC